MFQALKFHIPFLFVFSLAVSLSLFLNARVVQAAPTYSSHACTNSTTGPLMTLNSTYLSNLNLLLSYLTSNATSANNGFYNSVIGSGTQDTVISQFRCRGNVNNTLCRAYDANAIKYKKLELSYSNRSFFGTVDELPSIALINTENIMNPVYFKEIRNATNKAAAADAANGGQKKYATKAAYFSGFQTLYNLAQCTPDLSAVDCHLCLSDAIERLYRYSDRLGARVLFPSCNVRYELYPFYNNQTGSPSPTRPKEKRKMSTGTIMAIVVPIAVRVMVIFT